ncbi:MAG: thioesterase family protein [Chloroflexota bacterium]
MGDLELDTRLSGADGRYSITMSRDWDIWGPNGGYMAAVALRAAGMEAKIKRPVSIACHFLGVPRPDQPVDVRVRAVQAGRRAESIHVEYGQGDRAIVQAIVRTAAEMPGVAHNFARMPDVPHWSKLKSFLDYIPDPPNPVPFWTNLESRIIFTERLFEDEKPLPANLIEWYRFQHTPSSSDPFVDACRSVILMDTFAWPAGANPHPRNQRDFQGVNLDVVAWFYDLAPDAEWLLCDYESVIAAGGLVSGNGRIWTEDGRLIATGGAQVMCLPLPPELKDRWAKDSELMQEQRAKFEAIVAKEKPPEQG